ncbi:B3 domain-containing protein Os01g0723500-like isoform X2 [Pyrus x bretschneideri]|nr:B3 domain-containing protein Os01g0723500-like isoform X2 [Pyrus x bretschneideri]XP_048429173.1 B3 domain-containing protein Os01g0723500-like isoform X2 [Pyrus x bretschneideri]
MARMSKEEKKPTFFQIICKGFNTEKLTVPRKFLTHVLKELSERAILKLKGSSDYSWTVNVTKTPKGAVRFNGGWQEFLKDNSLGHGDFLVFTYDGKMQFSIDIFDNTACHRIDDKINPNSISSSGDDSVQNLSSSESSEFDESTEEEEDEEDDSCKDSEATCEDNVSEDSEATQTESFKSNFPHFECVIGESVFVPSAFSRKHFPQGKSFEVILKNAKGKKWEVKAYPANGSHFLSKGWPEFASANKIIIDSTCIFELLRANTMMVHIV